MAGRNTGTRDAADRDQTAKVRELDRTEGGKLQTRVHATQHNDPAQEGVRAKYIQTHHQALLI